MPYRLNDDPYVDVKTGTLYNLLGITDQRQLAQAEADITVVAIATLAEQPIVGNFDLAHLALVHKRLFGLIYQWAGELRNVELTKGNTRFANVNYLPQAAQAVFLLLREENYLQGLDQQAFIKRLVHYYSEVNVLHPFREGNGRAQRAFFSLLAAHNNRHIAWDKLDIQLHLNACIHAYRGDESYLNHLFLQIVS